MICFGLIGASCTEPGRETSAGKEAFSPFLVRIKVTTLPRLMILIPGSQSASLSPDPQNLR
jgi:hypothetical protein